MIRSPRRRVLAALFGVLLVAGAVLPLLRPADDPPPTPAAPPPKETPRTVVQRPRAPRSEPAVAETPPAASRFTADYEGPHGTPAAPVAVADASAAGRGPSRFRRVEVSVVDGSTGRPMPEVPVRRPGPGTWSPVSSMASNDKGEAEVSIHVEAPEGFGGLATHEWKGPVASRATTVRFVLPVFPMGDVALRFVDETGAPVAGVKEIRAMARNPWNGRDEVVELFTRGADDSGVATLEMPRIPFHHFALRATKRLPGDALHELGADFIVKPSDFGAETRTVVLALRTPTGSSARGSSSSGCGPDHEPEGEKAPLVVRLFHGDERPATLVTVALDDGSYLRVESDEKGVARFAALTKGPRRFLAFAHGFRPTPFRAAVGSDAMVDVRETPARIVDVIVEDAEGRRLPAACVTSRCASVVGPDGVGTSVGGWCSVAQLDGDVELATPLTGADGVVRLQEPAGRIDYRAQLGGAMVTESSAADVVRIVLRKD